METKIKIIIITIALFISIPLVFAATSYSSSNVIVDNTTSAITSLYLQDAIDEINYYCSVKSPSDYICKNNTPKCKRATTLHTEPCTNSDTSSYCQADGYALNETITYGNTTTTNGVLTVGDAFDCNVDGTGYNHRFYYISDYFDTSTKTFNDKVAVLVYYSNTDNGVASDSNVAYDCSSQNYNGPVTAIGDLPTTTEWSNIELYKNARQILTENNATSTSGETLPTAFDYSGYGARLLTYQELYHGCYDYNIGIDSTKGLSTNCKFLFERTKYANSSYATSGSWLETPSSNIANRVWAWNSYNRIAYYSNANYTSNYGARPTIEVLKSEISY